MGKPSMANKPENRSGKESVAAEYPPKEGLELELNDDKEKEKEVEDISGGANKEENSKRKGITNNDEDKGGKPRPDRHLTVCLLSATLYCFI